MASVAFAFGSFGDIVALINLCYDLAKTLHKGTSTEYQELILELKSLTDVLESVKQVITSQASTPIQRSSMNTIEFAVQKCHSLITDFKKRTQGYNNSLLKGEPGSNLWDFWWNIDWAIFKKGAIAELKSQLSQQKTAIMLVLSLANCVILNRVERRLQRAPGVVPSQTGWGDGWGTPRYEWDSSRPRNDVPVPYDDPKPAWRTPRSYADAPAKPSWRVEPGRRHPTPTLEAPRYMGSPVEPWTTRQPEAHSQPPPWVKEPKPINYGTRNPVPSWASWWPNPETAPSPLNLMGTPSPGLFGPRTPVLPEPDGPGLFGPRSPQGSLY